VARVAAQVAVLILHNLHIDGLRRKSRRPPHVGLDSVGVDRRRQPTQQWARPRPALQLLSGEQRQVVLLVLEGLTSPRPPRRCPFRWAR
jgi:DNA-directed RNA polymerase specialized sigma24 family protein